MVSIYVIDDKCLQKYLSLNGLYNVKHYIFNEKIIVNFSF